MKTVLPMLLLIVCSVAYAADSFDQRARNAHRLEMQADQRNYQNSLHSALMPVMKRIMASCRGQVQGNRPQPFSLVGDVTRHSSIEHIQVRPANGFAKCFADGMKKISVPAPPKNYEGRTYPITMDFRFH